MVDVNCIDDTNANNRHGTNTPLNIAAGEGHMGIAQLLIENGADITKASFKGLPLCSAASKGQHKCDETSS